MDFLGSFVGSAARAKVLRLFIFNPEDSFTVADIVKRAQITRTVAQKEVNFLKRISVVKVIPAKGKRPSMLALDTDSAHMQTLRDFVRDASSFEAEAITTKLRGAGRLKLVIASGTFVDDTASRVDLLVVADALNERRLQNALRTIEADLGRELRYAAFLTDEFRYRLTVYDKLVRDILDYPHRVFLDRIGVTSNR